MPLKAIVVEDIPATREAIVMRVNENAKLHVVETFEDVETATNYFLDGGAADVIFLDIALFGDYGWELLRTLRREKIPIPPVIVVTGEDERGIAETAFREFFEEVVDYIFKPLGKTWTDRQHECVRRIEARLRRIEDGKPTLTRLPISKGSVTEYVPVEEITCLTIGDNGLEVHFAGEQRRFVDPYGALGDYESKLPSPYFVRISRQAVVNANYVTRVKSNHKQHLAVLTQGEISQLECSRTGIKSLREVLAYG